jgi:AmmeMemoRadiSam system protein B/AmmeMemoRadiSam system protein A
VAFTYNDPIVWTEYAIDTARACHRLGIRTVAVTSGYVNAAPREAFYEHIDAANVDLKGFSEDFYHKLVGGRLAPVLDTLRWLAKESKVWLEITNLVIPGANDSPEEIRAMCRWIADELGPAVPLHFSAFHPDFKLTDRPATPPQTLARAYDIARETGLRYVYAGNVVDPEREATYCPGCGQAVIRRDGYRIVEYKVRGGSCAQCGAAIAGRFEDAPGDWGGRRQVVRIADYARSGGGAGAAPAGEPARPTGGTGILPVSAAEARARPRARTAVANLLPATTARPKLTEEQERQVFEAAGRRVAAVVRSQPMAQSLESLLGDTADCMVYGVFVSLKRGGQLRSCCGFLGQTVPLGEALEHAAVRAAKDDPRFPPIAAGELRMLDMEVWLLWGLQPVTARGEDRVGAVTIGVHGVQIARGSARGLLLPGVAVEHHLDARRFLQQVCLKAGLGQEAWRQDDTTLMTFEGYAIHGRLAELDLAPAAEPAGGPTAAEVANLAEFCRANLIALLEGATPGFYLPGGYDGGVHGLALAVGQPGSEGYVECSQISLHGDMPLQATLFRLTEATAGVLRSRRVSPDAMRSIGLALAVLGDPMPHGPVAGAKLAGIDPGRRAVLVAGGGGFALVYDARQTAEQSLREAQAAAGLAGRPEGQVYSLSVVSTAPRIAIARPGGEQPAAAVRPAAVAGGFYPGSAVEVRRKIEELFEPVERRPEVWPAALVPHAGWMYSGRLAAAVLSRLAIPGRVIVLAPKHRPGGANWAVAPHGRWAFPGGELAADPELARRLADAITGLKLDAAAHAQEHAIEVQLPLLAHLAPAVRVVGITIGGGTWPQLAEFAAQLAAVVRDLPERPLLLVSSDMNHFADEGQTRRLDRLALDAIQLLDPARLFETVERQRISMCGMRPAGIVMETLRQLDGLHRCEVVGYTTSAEASGDTSRVVGYAGVLLG